jgi:mediator of RNA polymerase II transcription subunit 22
MCSDEIDFFCLCLQVQAADSLLKLVSELKQSAVFSDFLSLNRSINQRILKFGEQSEETEKLLVSIGDEVADSLKDLESHYYASPNRGIECEVPYFQHTSNGDGA